MNQEKSKNHSINFLVVKNNYKKYKSYFVTAILVVIFGFGAGSLLLKLHPAKKAVTEGTNSVIPGWWYQQYFGASVCSQDKCKPDADPDQDKLTNAQEFFYHTNPLVAFTAKDQLNDGELVAAGFDPSQPGRKKIEEVASEENILSESLIFGQDIKQMVAEANDPSKVVLPQVQDDQIQIVNTQDEETYKTYFNKLQSTITKYFRPDDVAKIRETLKSGTDQQVIEIGNKAGLLSMELKTIAVPLQFVNFHKYNIILYQLLSEIMIPPSDLTGSESDIWYDKVQAFLVIQQKINEEEATLK